MRTMTPGVQVGIACVFGLAQRVHLTQQHMQACCSRCRCQSLGRGAGKSVESLVSLDWDGAASAFAENCMHVVSLQSGWSQLGPK